MSLLLFASGFGAGGLGALLGIGGGVILVPLLSLAFGVPLTHAVAISLACVIGSSTGAAASYVRDHRVDVRLGMKLEIFTVAGAILGAFIAPLLPTSALQILFALMLIPAAHAMLRPAPADEVSTLPEAGARNLPLGYAASFGAGGLSAVLGIGGGPIKVPVMTMLMGVPFKVASATSNFMIGVTASASVFIYYSRGLLDLSIATPTVLGVMGGAWLGSRLMPHIATRSLKRLFAVLLVVLSVQMFLKGVGVELWGGP